jgi:predicted Zn-dependent protease
MAGSETAFTLSLTTALAHGRQLLARNPELALEQASEILAHKPSDPEAMLLAADAHLALGETEAAVARLRDLTRSKPAFADGWRALGDQLHIAGDTEEGDRAHHEALLRSASDPELIAAAGALMANDIPVAEAALRRRLKAHPTDVAAIRMLAEVAGRIGRYRDAETLLRRALELASGFLPARHNLALLLHRHGEPAEALRQIDMLLEIEPANATYQILKAAILGRLGDHGAAIDLYRAVLARFPRQSKVWMSLGHVLKTVGRIEDGIEAYRESLRLEPTLGRTWWSIANLKTFRFTDEDVAQMRAALMRTDVNEEDRANLHFALGKAEEDAENFEESFVQYAEGNRQRRERIEYDAALLTGIVDRQVRDFDASFFASRAGWGCPASDPIFIVSLPRSGSTLIEQVLASHSAIEGTMELPDISMMVGRLGAEGVRGLSEADARKLGEEYLQRTSVQRKLDRPHFVDKAPNNWTYLAFIHLILPNARIIDARRHPLGCGFSVFKQNFARGQSFSYDLEDIGRYYFDYVRALAHVDRILPGRVHRIFYERMVEETEVEVRALLAHLGLEFEPACLRFYETERSVRTASSEQVRRPIYREGIEQWRNYEPWLEPLARVLGPIATGYPDVPRRM